MAEIVERLVGVYDRDSSLAGELGYALGRRLGRSACALSDVTHGLLGSKPAWQEARLRFPVPIDLVHLDEREGAIAVLTGGRTPCVVADLVHRWDVLIERDRIEACAGSPAALIRAIREEAAARDWVFPPRG